MSGISQDEFEKSLRKTAEKTLAVIRRFIHNERDAEDVLQEVYLSAWKARDSFDAKSKISTWIHKIAVNTSINKLKQLKRLSTNVQPITNIELMTDKKNEIEQVELREVVWKAIDKLPEDQRIVLLLRDLEGYKSSEIAIKLGIDAAAVRQRLHRARRYIGETLSPELCNANEMTCGGRLDLLFDMIDKVLLDDLKDTVLNHVKNCKGCNRYAEIYRRTISLPKKTALTEQKVSENLIQNVLRSIRII